MHAANARLFNPRQALSRRIQRAIRSDTGGEDFGATERLIRISTRI
jgi:hypothetical protein